MTLSWIRNSGIILLFFVTIFITSNVHAKKYPEGYPKCWQDPENPVKALDKDFKKIDLSKPNLGQDPELFLPVNSKVGHKFILVDFTSPWKKPQIDWIEDRIFENALVKTTPPYWKVAYMKIDDTAAQSQEIAYSQGRMKTGNKSNFIGEETNTGCEGHKKIIDKFASWYLLNSTFKKEFLKNYEKESAHSLIFEYLFHVLREPVIDFTSEYPVRELVIVSDLMQHSDRFSFYSHCKQDSTRPNKCKSFDSLLEDPNVKNYINDRKPNKDTLQNLKITILYINHAYETREGLSGSLVALWEDLFKYIGIENYEIVKQLDIP